MFSWNDSSIHGLKLLQNIHTEALNLFFMSACLLMLFQLCGEEESQRKPNQTCIRCRVRFQRLTHVVLSNPCDPNFFFKLNSHCIVWNLLNKFNQNMSWFYSWEIIRFKLFFFCGLTKAHQGGNARNHLSSNIKIVSDVFCSEQAAASLCSRESAAIICCLHFTFSAAEERPSNSTNSSS